MTEPIAPMDPSQDPMHPYGNPCNVCSTAHDEDEWGILGWIGIIPLSLCANCAAGIVSMVMDYTPLEEIEEVVAMRKMQDASGEETTDEL
jgi:hypothetical protein